MTWNEILKNETEKDYYKNELVPFLQEEYSHYECYPKKDNIFNAFFSTPSFYETKVVIIGQDPYHEPGQAQGLSFSVPNDVKRPPSLVNIVKELEKEYDKEYGNTNDLTYLAKQGVLLLNTTLTVRKGEPTSHCGHGWETFTDNIIKILGERNDPMVFLLWGKHAQSKKKFIINSNALVLCTSHPSPFSYKRGFDGCGHFKKCNDFLLANGLKEVTWFPETYNYVEKIIDTTTDTGFEEEENKVIESLPEFENNNAIQVSVPTDDYYLDRQIDYENRTSNVIRGYVVTNNF